MKKIKIITVVLLFILTNVISQNRVYIETNINCSCEKKVSKLDSIMQLFTKDYKNEFSSNPYAGIKKIEDVFLEKTHFFENQLGVKKIRNHCCSKFSSMYSKIIIAEDTVKMNCTVFEYSFHNNKDVSEIKTAFEKYNKTFFVSNTQYYFKYFISKNNVYIVSTSSVPNYNVEISLFNQFCNFIKNVI